MQVTRDMLMRHLDRLARPPVRMAEGGLAQARRAFAQGDPVADAGAYINEAAGRRRGEREARGERVRGALARAITAPRDPISTPCARPLAGRLVKASI